MYSYCTVKLLLFLSNFIALGVIPAWQQFFLYEDQSSIVTKHQRIIKLAKVTKTKYETAAQQKCPESGVTQSMSKDTNMNHVVYRKVH